ncbi:MAG: hypothetical protein JWR49_1279, partial [Tardiphaga sp.]|nr:hypothetical protein [Tardiphaga sp.]
MSRRALDDRSLKALKPREAVYDVPDTVVPGLGVRVSPRGRKTFVFVARYGGAKYPTRRSLGVYDAISLDQARTKARAWLEAIHKGQDPKLQEDRDRVETIKREKVTFSAVV